MKSNWIIDDLLITKSICEMNGDTEKSKDLTKVINVIQALFDEEESVSKKQLVQSSIPIIQIVKTFEDALSICPASANEHIILSYNGIDKKMLSYKAYVKLTIIAEALNQGWVPDWKNSGEYKYYPYFWMDKTGSGFVFDGAHHVHTYSPVGSRLCFQTRELAEYAGRNFVKIYEEFMS